MTGKLCGPNTGVPNSENVLGTSIYYCGSMSRSRPSIADLTYPSHDIVLFTVAGVAQVKSTCNVQISRGKGTPQWRAFSPSENAIWPHITRGGGNYLAMYGHTKRKIYQ